MTDLETMVAAYMEAIDFTECGDTDQPEHGAELSAYDKAQAHSDCRNFYWGVEWLGYRTTIKDWAQVGHDLWLTRNGHGVGFWARPEIYGEGESQIYTAMAKAMGEHDVTFEEEDDIATDESRSYGPRR